MRDEIVAEFLTTPRITDSLEKIIKQAKKKLILISPYLQINPRIRNLLEAKDREIRTKVESPFSKLKALITKEGIQREMKIVIVYRKGEVRTAESSWLQGIPSIQTSALSNLHAKCYLNEDYALITSMNLYQSSQVHNYEIGILVARGSWSDRERKLYKSIEKHVLELIGYGEKKNVTVNSVTPSNESSTPSEAVVTTPNRPKQTSSRKTTTAKPTPERLPTGHCIRCGDPMTEAISKPFCEQHWNSWNHYQNADYSEKFCHLCGRPSETSKGKPLCLNCFRK